MSCTLSRYAGRVLLSPDEVPCLCACLLQPTPASGTLRFSLGVSCAYLVSYYYVRFGELNGIRDPYDSISSAVFRRVQAAQPNVP
ncbi:hypothetical protein LX32DRAFT_644089 [Colletotrichum zoysiae]|uniref:Uncharacterized protein n=1 Tax=Colletotrichum zoysiae TaxID=1216348 RepID=A0AAD9LZH9_9PEZI|nr:hypothetical protein LX32DRAFT_644089 [Colletotrichum zoysiae]